MYNLSSSQSDRISFDEMCYQNALWTFEAAPDAWLTWNQELAEDIVEQDSQDYSVDDIDEAKARQLNAIKKAYYDNQENNND